MFDHIQKILSLVAKDSDCPRAVCAVVAFSNDDVPYEITGCNHHVGAKECVIEDGHCVSAIHAEAQMVANAARLGIDIFQSEVWSTQRPCNRCLILMYQAGVRKVYFLNDYHSKAHGEDYISQELMDKMSVEQYAV